MTKKTLFLVFFMLVFARFASATTHPGDRQDIPSAKFVSAEFSPEWYVRVIGGCAYSLGEADFTDLLSPAARLSVGYDFSRFIGARLSFGGWQARGRYNYPNLDYRWNYILSSAEIVLDITSIFGSVEQNRLVSLNLFAGGGAAAGFRNIEAARMRRNSDSFYGFAKLWTGTKAFWGAIGGLEVDFRLARCLSLCLESDAMMFPDDFNSKVGKDDAFDWQFNCLVGLKFSFGR